MHNYRKIITQDISIHLRMKQYLFCLGFFMLAPGYAFSSVNHTPTAEVQEQTSIRSFHETTELAETLWADLTNRFIAHYEKSEYQKALSVAQRAYDIANQNFGPNDTNTADTLLKLGIINQTMGNLGKAENYFLQSLAILEKQLSPDHSDVAVIMTNLGNVYFDLQRPEKSGKFHRKALRIRQNAFGDSDPTVAQSKYNLAVLYESQKKYGQAADYYRQAISSWSASIGPTHPYVGNALNNLSNVYYLQGNYKKATTVLRRTVDYKKLVFGTQHEEVAQTLISLGTNYLEQGKYSPASNAYEEALDIAQHVLNSSDPQLALLMYTLANIYHTQARIEVQNTQSPADADVLKTNDTITNVTPQKASLFEQALPLYEKAAEILGDSESNAQSALDVILTELAMLYKEIGNTDMAQATESRIATH